MHRPETIEDILSRLMPPALSESGQMRIESVIDELAGTYADSPSPAVARPFARWRIGGGLAAAAAVALGALIFANRPQATRAAASAQLADDAPQRLFLLEQSGRVDETADVGVIEDPDGASLRAWRYHVVENDRIRDEETGLVVEVSQPRDEFVLMPVSAF